MAVAYDPAFCFYYQDNLDLLEAEGAELVRFSPMNDQALPPADLLYLGGGYPELYGEQLSGNAVMRKAIRDFARGPGVIYAECGGMMYLTQAIRDFEGRTHSMVGLFPAVAVMAKASMTLGYRTVLASKPSALGQRGFTIKGHEFHYSRLVPEGPLAYACELTDACGVAKGQDGLMADNAVAFYTHLHFASQPHIAKALCASARGSV